MDGTYDSGPERAAKPAAEPASGPTSSLAPSLAAVLALQRTAGNQAVTRLLRADAPAPPPPDGSAPPGAGPAPGLIVPDSADPEPHQQRLGEFRGALRGAISAAVAGAVAGTPWTPPDDSELDARLAPYAGLDAAGLEQAIRRDVPGAAGATSAEALISAASARARAAVVADLGGGVANQVTDLGAQIVQGATSVLAGIGSILFKRRGQRGAVVPAPGELGLRLGPGQPMEDATRGRMESTLGVDLSGVRVHADGTGAAVSDELDAHAFAVGEHVGFGHGAYAPGTPVGDALIAHELAHVVQQRGAEPGGTVAEEPTAAVEQDADRSAAHVLRSLWGKEQGVDQLLAGDDPPAARTRIGLQRCSRAPTPPPTKVHNLPEDATLLSSPGERVLFGCLFASNRPQDFEVLYAATDGAFDGGQKTKTIDGLEVKGLPFVLPQTWDGTAIEVTFKIRRKKDGAVSNEKTWHIGKKAFVPTTISQFEHGPQPIAAGGQVNFLYLLGPKPPPGWTGKPEGPFYTHDTILERFEGGTCNVVRDELKPEFANAHPELTTSAEIAAFFFPDVAFNASFNVFGKEDAIEDQNGTNGIERGGPDLVSKLKAPKDVVWEKVQVFEAQPNVALGRYTIRRTYHHATGSLTIEKVGP